MKKISFHSLAFLFAILFSTAFAGPVSHFGALEVCSNNICGKKTGTSVPLLLKGPSLFWSDGSGAPFYRLEVVDWFVDNMEISVIRAAMGIRWYGDGKEEINVAGGTRGYYFDAVGQKTLIKKVIDAAIANDIYVIVDWHSHNAHSELSLAKAFFKEMATEYKDVPNIIWEVYNEPINASVGEVTTYADGVVSEIRSTGNTNLVLIGSPQWSKQPQQQSANWGSSKDKNVAFTFHFYAASHTFPSGDNIGTSAQNARSAGYAVFGSEWGAVNYDGDGNVNTSATDSWTNWMDQNNVSNCMWNASSAPKPGQATGSPQGSSMFVQSANAASLSTSNLTNSGKYFQTYMGKNKWTAKIPSNHPRCKDVVSGVTVNDGNSVTLSSQLGLTGEVTGFSSVSSGELSIGSDKKSIVYATSNSGSPDAKARFIYKVTQNSITVQCKAIIDIANRRPILPAKDPIAVSRRTPRGLSLTSTLSASDPTNSGLELTNVSVSPSSIGSAAITQYKDSIIFTPDPSQYNVEFAEATLSYTVKAKAGSTATSTGSVVLRVQNMAPTITAITNTTCCQLTSVPNTAPKGINIANFNGKDADGDPIWFEKMYLDPKYPGRLEKVSNDSFVYYPEAGKKGKVVLLAVITDGTALSPTGRANMTLTGDGTDIGTITPPTEIPGHVDPPIDPCEVDPSSCQSPIISGPAGSGSLGLKSLASGRVELYFAHSGHAKLDVYSLSGKHMGSLLNGWQNAGSSEASLKNLGLQKGVYILRLQHGSQVKTVRIVN
ncbi:MAG: cellulase family glycosylhydrolase [Fibromonadales bacterium]|nr:cellulase family glycosylhydrolase [Fibromonadales bacterium]